MTKIPVLHGREQFRVSVHEAAHAVISLALNLDVASVVLCRLGANDAFGGWMTPRPSATTPTPAATACAVNLAGLMAEKHFFGVGREDCASVDLAAARRILEDVFDDDRDVEEAFQSLSAWTLEGVAEHQEWIRITARALRARGSLTGNQVRALRPLGTNVSPQEDSDAMHG